jgi:hypothetical protein
MRVHTVAIIMLLALGGSASAQTAGGTSGPAGSSLGAMPNSGSLFGSPGDGSTFGGSSFASPSTDFTTGLGYSSPPSVAGVPNTSTPGIIGTDATPSGLPGDDPQHPGFPAPLH